MELVTSPLFWGIVVFSIGVPVLFLYGVRRLAVRLAGGEHEFAVDEAFALVERVVPACLAVTMQQNFFFGFKEKDFKIIPLFFKRFKDRGIFGQKTLFTQVHHKGQTCDLAAALNQ